MNRCMPMIVERYDNIEELRAAAVFADLLRFQEQDPNTGFFQSPDHLEFIRAVRGFRPVIWVARGDDGHVAGSLLGVYQRDGHGPKSWLSRRLIVHGGPLGGGAAASSLISALLKDARGKAIYVEFRNAFDTDHLRGVFEEQGFAFSPHLNFIVDLDGEEVAMKRLAPNRRRQVRNGAASGAVLQVGASEEELRALYGLFVALYREKVHKPLPDFSLFQRFSDSPHGRVLLVKYSGRVIGGSLGPVHNGEVAYQWFAYGDNSVEGAHASVMATWAHIAWAAREGYRVFDFMGAGKPGQGYGVHEFKSRFGGTEVCHGRYGKVLAPALYKLGVLGLAAYHRVMRLLPSTN